MADARFFHRAGPFSLRDIAAVVGAEPVPADDEAVSIGDLAALDSAGPDDISVFTGTRYLSALALTRAGAIIISRKLAHHAAPTARLLYVGDPRRAYAQVGRLFYPPQTLQPGAHASASVHPSACIGPGTQIDAGAVIGRDVDIGERCHIGPNVVIGDGVLIGDDCRIGANCAISHALIGHRVEIETCVTIGSQGFGFVPGPAGLERMLQLGRVVVEENVKIGANCAIDRGATEDTVIGAGSVLDNLVHIGHNVRLGRHCVICGQVGIAGSTVVGDGVMMGGQTGVADHLTIGARAQIAAKSGVMRNVEPGTVVGGFPAVPIKDWHRQTTSIARLVKKVDS
jgi:UDP-3-O-[3-hydroxymyristoyl] glucosamine N-acyltransferase